MSGTMHEEHGFTFQVRVPYALVDQMGVVYYAHYFVYFEMARAELLRKAGMPYGDMEKAGVLLPAVEAHCVYRKPARFDDLLDIAISRVEIHGTRVRLDYEVTRGDVLIATGYSDHVCMSPEGRVLRPVPELKKLAEFRPSPVSRTSGGRPAAPKSPAV
jgi:acyl-CoA thioester hydrolase